MRPGDREGIGEGTDTVIPGDEAIMLEIFSGDGHGENNGGGGSEMKISIIQVVQRRMLVVTLIDFFCFVVSMFDLVHDVGALFPLPQLLTASGNFF